MEKNKTGWIILILLILIVTGNLILRFYGEKVEIRRFTETYLQESIDNFYEKSPELISYGKNFDLKYDFYNQYDQSENHFKIVMKGDYYDIKKIKVSFCKITENGCEKVFSEGYVYEDDIFTKGQQGIVTISDFWIGEFTERWHADSSKYDLHEVEIELFYADTSEKFKLKAQKDSLINLYKPDVSCEEGIKSYSSHDIDTIFNPSGYNVWIDYLHNLYYYDQEKYRTELSKFTDALLASDKRKEILENSLELFEAYRPFIVEETNNFSSPEIAKFIYGELKRLYSDESLDISYVESKLILSWYAINEQLHLRPQMDYHKMISEIDHEDIDIHEVFMDK